jgi:hypothetical protein
MNENSEIFFNFYLNIMFRSAGSDHLSCASISIHLLTGYEGNTTFIVTKVPTIVRGNTEYQVYKCFIILNNCAIQNSKL